LFVDYLLKYGQQLAEKRETIINWMVVFYFCTFWKNEKHKTGIIPMWFLKYANILRTLQWFMPMVSNK
jgi:hypothetical protein